ncbi:PadR family transcriptional regulator [Sulfolobus acidocaldarius]|uniref:PadR family transcriptional regulator n=2 Tax=Sulfolobus acidocaldarius TaxID=2285 RepID=UPI000780A9C2|nr:PadR family transcriptional regulator [Sulfolobus acidocaldarius]
MSMKKIVSDRVRRGTLRLLVLSSLAEKPMYLYAVSYTHLLVGSEMCIRDRTKAEGFYRPSTGSIYPVLRSLARDGYIIIQERDGKKIYSLTDKGVKKVEEIKIEIESLFTRDPLKRRVIDLLFNIGLTVHINRKKIDDKVLNQLITDLEKCMALVEEAIKSKGEKTVTQV